MSCIALVFNLFIRTKQELILGNNWAFTMTGVINLHPGTAWPRGLFLSWDHMSKRPAGADIEQELEQEMRQRRLRQTSLTIKLLYIPALYEWLVSLVTNLLIKLEICVTSPDFIMP